MKKQNANDQNSNENESILWFSIQINEIAKKIDKIEKSSKNKKLL